MRSYYSNALYSKFNPKLGVNEVEIQAESRRKCSRSSFVSISNSFVERVEHMNSIILVPTKLIDIDCKEDPLIPAIVQNGTSNLYEVYTAMKQFKEKLVSMALEEDQIGSISPFKVESSPDSLLQMSSMDSGLWSSTGSTVMSSISSNGSVSEEDGSCGSDNELSEVNYRVKRSLNSAKGMAAFLVELFETIDYLVQRYCMEFDCEMLA